MNAFEGVIDDLNNSNLAFIENEFKTCNEVWQGFNGIISKIKNAVQVYKETGVGPKLDFENWETCQEVEETTKTPTNSNERSSFKENVQPNENGQDENATLKTRPRRNAFKEATQNINHQSSMSLNAKLRRPDQLSEDFQNVYIKKEKKSVSTMSDVKVKIEADEMPAPTRPAPRKKKQKKTETRIQVKSEKVKEEIVENTSESQGRDSDVILQDATVTMVNLLDSDDNEKTLKNEEDSVRSTRTKTKQKKKLGKRTRVLSSDEETDRTTEKRSKSGSEQLQNGDLSTKTNYEDAVSTLETNNATFVANSPVNKNLGAPPATMNATVVVENPKYVNNNLVPAPVTADDLLTDDESEDEKKRKTPPPTVTKIPSKFPKQVFSPFELSPVKKKVQAFEKLKEANSIPVRVTRTKTRAVAKEQEEVAADETEAKSVVKEKAKLFTPMTSKFLPTASSTNVKVNRLQSATSSNESLISAKSASALKASQAEYRERERRRREKEQEALKKREALLQAQIEEKKRKREEKQLKAQQQREALEKEKLKALEAQRLKDERHKQLLAEQEERKQKQKEELERKRMMAKMRAIEEKKREEEKRLEEERKAEEMAAKLARQDEKIAMSVQKQKMQRQQVPVYLKTKAPLLPTQDCYDSDDETHERGHIKEHSWARGGSLRELQFCMKAAGDTVMNSFFSRQAQTPDLQEIFEVIEPRKLKRSSSAVWHKPPRYTMMPCLDEYSEDDELFED